MEEEKWRDSRMKRLERAKPTASGAKVEDKGRARSELFATYAVCTRAWRTSAELSGDEFLKIEVGLNTSV